MVALTGGPESPWGALFGLVIIGTGFGSEPLLPVVAAVGASAAWLLSGYARRLGFVSALPPQALLLQVSAWLLAGGVIGALVRRRTQSEQRARRAERVHRRLKLAHANVLAAMQEGVVLVGEGMRVLDANPAARRMLGEPIEDEIRRLFAQRPELWDGVRERTPVEAECERGERVWLVRYTPMPALAEGVITLVDATRMRELERALAREAHLAELGRMAAMLAHEVRNPVHNIQQALELMGDHPDTELWSIVREEGARLARLVDSMLNFARPIKPRLEAVRARPWFEKLVHGYAVPVRLEIEDLAIEADPDLLRIVLDNLAHNAIRAGAKALTLRLRAERGRWQLALEDDAGGVPEALRAQLFEPFVSGRADGVGLGLATVKRIAEACGWQVALSDGARGACFTITGGRVIDGDDPAR
ncbi:MAG: PAS domain-containing protein [Zetaproteobacteria bacterium]|nr:MAG: PAS domain-containing protein [Zetaproteobacteria bacterium]